MSGNRVYVVVFKLVYQFVEIDLKFDSFINLVNSIFQVFLTRKCNSSISYIGVINDNSDPSKALWNSARGLLLSKTDLLIINVGRHTFSTSCYLSFLTLILYIFPNWSPQLVTGHDTSENSYSFDIVLIHLPI